MIIPLKMTLRNTTRRTIGVGRGISSLVVVVLLLILITVQQAGSDNVTSHHHSYMFPQTNYRHGKLFSLFNIVTFKKSECNTGFGVTGICMTLPECQVVADGVPSGSCASGFGVCCVTTKNSCGSTIDQNCTYLVNPGYPGVYEENGMWEYTVKRCSSDICFIRLDYEVRPIH